MKQAVESPHVVKTKGPYVQGVEVTDAKLVYTSGVLARDAARRPAQHRHVAGHETALHRCRVVAEGLGDDLRADAGRIAHADGDGPRSLAIAHAGFSMSMNRCSRPHWPAT